MKTSRRVLSFSAMLTSCLAASWLLAGPAFAAGSSVTFGTASVRPIVKDLVTIIKAMRKAKTAADAVKLQKTLSDMTPAVKKDAATFDAASAQLDTVLAAKKPLTADQKKALAKLKVVENLDQEIEGHEARLVKLNPKLDATFKGLDL